MPIKIKKQIFAIIVFIVAFVGIVAIQRNDTEKSVPSATLSVELRADGYYPKEITINKGDTVVFSTTRNGWHWPASNLHPTHKIYGEFDPKEPIDADKTWSFKFDKTGVWNYHDHLAPLYVGTITVGEPDKTKVLGSKTDCIEEDTDKYRCWEREINLALEKNGLDSAFDKLALFFAADASFDCHSFAHELGKSTYYRFAEHKEPALSVKSNYCGYGFYHGFMETLLQKTGNPQEARDFCEYVGEQLRVQAPDSGGACYHGIGHGAVDGSDPTAWGDAEAMIAPGMKICTTVSLTEPQLYRCITGVFNSIEILSYDDKYKLFELQKDPFSLCHNQPANYREGCYTNMLPALMRENSLMEIAKIVEETIQNDDDYEIRGMVILSLFHESTRAALSANKTDYTEIIDACHSLDARSRLPCITGLSGGFMKYGEPKKEYIKALAFCKSGALKEDETDKCYNNILAIVPIFYQSEKVKEICQTVEDKYRHYCAN